jgi:hypothetical protein
MKTVHMKEEGTQLDISPKLVLTGVSPQVRICIICAFSLPANIPHYKLVFKLKASSDFFLTIGYQTPVFST